MHLTRMRLGGVPPFTEPVEFKFDERVNVFVGPNASGKSTVLNMLAWRFGGLDVRSQRLIAADDSLLDVVAAIVPEAEFEESVEETARVCEPIMLLSSSDDKFGVTHGDVEAEIEPALVRIGSVRELLPSMQEVRNLTFGRRDVGDILAGPFTGLNTIHAYGEARHYLFWNQEPDPERPGIGLGPALGYERLLDALLRADKCSRYICGEVIEETAERNQSPGPYSVGLQNHPQTDAWHRLILPAVEIGTNDVPNFALLPEYEQPTEVIYANSDDAPRLYVGHLSSGTEGTLLWIRWLVLKILHHYDYADEWEKQPAILLIDEIENHLHPTWQRRVIPALRKHLPGLQIFATTHSPFVVAGLKAGQVHMLKRDAAGVVTASTNERDIIGWTTDEILRTFMGVDEPTDQLTIDRANRLRELRRKEALADAERDEMEALRRQVNEDFLSSVTPLGRERERLGDMMLEFLRSRQSDLSQDGG